MNYQSGEKLKPNKNRNQAGFSLIEMITSISLIVIITAIFIANYRSSNKRTDLIMTAQELVSDIHTAQNNTLGLIKYGLEVPAGGWGINFDSANPRQYILFADLDRPASNEADQDQVWEADPGFMSYDEELGEGDIEKGARIVDLPPGIIIDSIIIGSGIATSTLANVTFLPPDPKTYIFNGLATSTELRVALKDERENVIKTVRVNFLGLVEVIN